MKKLIQNHQSHYLLKSWLLTIAFQSGQMLEASQENFNLTSFSDINYTSSMSEERYAYSDYEQWREEDREEELEEEELEKKNREKELAARSQENGSLDSSRQLLDIVAYVSLESENEEIIPAAISTDFNLETAQADKEETSAFTSYVSPEFAHQMEIETKNDIHNEVIPAAIEVEFNLETAIGPSQEMQDFDSELFTGGGEHSQKVKAPPPVNDCGSKYCVSWPDPIAVSRLNQPSEGFSNDNVLTQPFDRTALSAELEKEEEPERPKVIFFKNPTENTIVSNFKPEETTPPLNDGFIASADAYSHLLLNNEKPAAELLAPETDNSSLSLSENAPQITDLNVFSGLNLQNEKGNEFKVDSHDDAGSLILNKESGSLADAPPSPTLETDHGLTVVTPNQTLQNIKDPQDALAQAQATDNAQPTAAPTAQMKEITVNFNNVSIIEFLRFISRIANKNFVFDDQDLQFNVTIVSEEPTTIENLMAALLQELRIHNLYLLEQGDNFIIHTNVAVRTPGQIVAPGQPGSAKANEIVTRVFRLNTLDPNKAGEIIRPLLSDTALVEVLRDTNNLIITDLIININKITQLINTLDAPHSGVTVGQYVVRSGYVESLVDLANRILAPIAQGNPYILVPHGATNSIYVVSNPFIVEKALAILENLDINEGRTKILSLDQLRLREAAEQEAARAAAAAQAAKALGQPGAPPNIPGTPEYNPNLPAIGPAAGYNIPGTPGYNPNAPTNLPPPEAGFNIPGTPGYNPNAPTNLPPPEARAPGAEEGYNIPGTPGYNPNLPSKYPFGTPGAVTTPTPPVFNPAAGLVPGGITTAAGAPYVPPPPGLAPGGVETGGRPGIFAPQEFVPGGISTQPRWVQGLPTGHIERTLFFIYKLKYRKGDQIELALQKIGQSLLRTGNANADIVEAINSNQWIEASNSLIFTGTYQALERIKELIMEIDLPLRQVYIEMLILDTTIQEALNYGVDWGTRFGGGGTTGGQSNLGLGSTLDSNLNSGTEAAAAAGQVIAGGTPPSTRSLLAVTGYSLGIIGRHVTHNGQLYSTVGALLEASYTDTNTKIILSPKIITEDNNTAEIFVGSTERYKTQSISNDQGSVITNNFQFLDVGTTLRVTPQIGNNGIITMDIVEQNSANNAAANATSANPSVVDVNLVPVVNTTRLTTRVHVPNGFFVILSGFISDTETDTLTRVPCLGGIPFIGALNKQQGNSDLKRNIMIFIRPIIVDSEEELENITKRQQDVMRDKSKQRRTWNYEIDEALDFFNLKSTNPNDYPDPNTCN